MKVQELRQMTPAKLQELLKEARRKLAVTRFHVQTAQEQNTSEIRKQKKLVARILTLLHNEKTAQ